MQVTFKDLDGPLGDGHSRFVSIIRLAHAFVRLRNKEISLRGYSTFQQ